ncbi:hypothetical protein OH77DRAFT_1233225 [Trametes cingulata]|nr:hypothetical protein OH77DRAFT_1233225 [Trametes cingulata]
MPILIMLTTVPRTPHTLYRTIPTVPPVCPSTRTRCRCRCHCRTSACRVCNICPLDAADLSIPLPRSRLQPARTARLLCHLRLSASQALAPCSPALPLSASAVLRHKFTGRPSPPGLGTRVSVLLSQQVLPSSTARTPAGRTLDRSASLEARCHPHSLHPARPDWPPAVGERPAEACWPVARATAVARSPSTPCSRRRHPRKD